MTATANGVDLLITAGALILLLAIALLTAWRRDDQARRLERLKQRGLA